MSRVQRAGMWMLAASLAAGTFACREEGPAERAGRQADEAIERAQEGAEGAMERLGREVDEAAEATSEAKEQVEDAAEEVTR